MSQSKDQISHDELAEQLEDGIIKFFFQKTGGELRIAHGTTNLDNIPEEHHPSGEGNPIENTIPFFDINKSAWRSVSRDSVVWKA